MSENIINSDHRINYLRLSITDRCNLRCMYCMPEDGINFQSHKNILSYEEILNLVRLAIKTGIQKVRLTGGEPLVRKGFIPFLKEMAQLEGLNEITLTTNGVLLKEFASDLKACGISRVNISLDSLNPLRFQKITGRDNLTQVLDGIKEAERLGFDPIKINMVAMKGVNDDEIIDFARMTIDSPYHVRYIELMPVGKDNSWSHDKFISIEEIQKRIETIGILKPVDSGGLEGPAERFILPGGKGELGFIGAMSRHFCDTCNRLRLTADGHLRSCLFSDKEIDIKTPLREGQGDQSLSKLIFKAIENKQKKNDLVNSRPRKCVRQMSSIGG